MMPGPLLAGHDLRAFHAAADELDRQVVSLRQDALIAAVRN